MQPDPIDTPRLVLRPFKPSDAPDVQRLAGEFAVADTTLNIPHPYEDGMAEEWISTHASGFEQGENAAYAITVRADGQLVGAISLMIDRRFDKAELGYWIGQPFWNRGYCTEAAIAMLHFGFGELKLNRIGARFFARNPASGRVMEKAGMQHEGVARQATKKWDRYEDMVLFGALRDEWSDPADG